MWSGDVKTINHVLDMNGVVQSIMTKTVQITDFMLA